jgi:ABC-type oligopeptide transport system substrate-binding subunit
MFRPYLHGVAALALATTIQALPLAAQELRIGVASEPSSADPHFHNLGPNNQLRRNILNRLLEQTKTKNFCPSLPKAGGRLTNPVGNSNCAPVLNSRMDQTLMPMT